MRLKITQNGGMKTPQAHDVEDEKEEERRPWLDSLGTGCGSGRGSVSSPLIG